MPDIDIVARLKLAGEEFSAKFKGTMDKLESDAKGASSRINTSLGRIGEFAAGNLLAGGIEGVARSLASVAERALDYASSLDEVSQQLGVTAQDLGVYRYAASQVGVSQEEMDKSLAKLTLTIGKAAEGSKVQAEAFNKLGINVHTAGGAIQATGAVIPQIADALEKIKDPAARAALEVELFGKTGQKLDTLLAGGSAAIGSLREEAERLGLVLSREQIEKADAAADAFARVKLQLEVNIAGVVADNAGAIESLANAFGHLIEEMGPGVKYLRGAIEFLREAQVRIGIGQDTLAQYTLGRSSDRAAATARLPAARSRLAQLQSDAYEDDLSGRFPIPTKATQALLDTAPATGANAIKGAADGAAKRAGDAAKAAFEKQEKAIQDALKDARKGITDLLSSGTIDSDKAASDSLRAYYARLNIDPTVDLSKIRDAIDKKQDLEGEARDRAFTAQVEADDKLKAHQEDNIRSLSDLYQSAFEGGTGSIWKTFKREGEAVIAEIAARYTIALLSGQKTSLAGIIGSAAGTGSPLDKLSGVTGLLGVGGGGLFSKILGGGGLSTSITSAAGGAQIFGASGAAAGGGLLGGLGGIGGALSAAVPYAAVAAIALPLITGLFKKTPHGSATITGVEGFTLSGNSSAAKSAASGAAGSVQSGLAGIAEQLGATIGSFAVSIGQRHGDYRVDTTGSGITKKAKGALDFDGDQQAAIQAAIADAVKDGAITGISAAAQRLLQSGGDLDKQIAKAASIESIPKELKAKLDPVGAAIDAVVDKYTSLAKVMDEAGASADQRAQAEQLYKLELDDVEKSSGGAKEALQSFLDSLKIGSSSPYSLRDQEAAAQAALQPYLDKIGGGQSIDQDKYQAAAQSFLDIERQLYGSTQANFDAIDKIQAATNAAIANIDAVTPIRTTPIDPFTQKTAENVQTGNELLSQVSDLLTTNNALLAQIAAGGGSAGSSGIDERYGYLTGTGF